VGVGADYVKFGAVNRQERLAKYNRLSQIYQELTTMAATVAAQTPAVETPSAPIANPEPTTL
jgi:enolase